MSMIANLFRPRVINERTKLYIFDLVRVFTWMIRPYYFFRYRNVKNIKLVLGSGPYYAKSWINIEVNPVFKKDIWADLRNPLPFGDNSVNLIYSSHVFEHLFIDEFHWVLKESYRVLRPGGTIRICLPCLRKNVEAYMCNDTAFFQWEPEELDPFKDDTISAKFSRNVLVDGGHKNMFDYSSLSRVLQSVGFSGVTQQEYLKSAVLSRENIEAVEPAELNYRSWNSFVVEARK